MTIINRQALEDIIVIMNHQYQLCFDTINYRYLPLNMFLPGDGKNATMTIIMMTKADNYIYSFIKANDQEICFSLK